MLSNSNTVRKPKIKEPQFKVYDRKGCCPKSDCLHQGVYYLGTDFITLPPKVEAVHHYSCGQIACQHTWTTLAS